MLQGQHRPSRSLRSHDRPGESLELSEAEEHAPDQHVDYQGQRDQPQRRLHTSPLLIGRKGFDFRHRRLPVAAGLGPDVADQILDVFLGGDQADAMRPYALARIRARASVARRPVIGQWRSTAI